MPLVMSAFGGKADIWTLDEVMVIYTSAFMLVPRTLPPPFIRRIVVVESFGNGAADLIRSRQASKLREIERPSAIGATYAICAEFCHFCIKGISSVLGVFGHTRHVSAHESARVRP